jgi:hypothetical protein
MTLAHVREMIRIAVSNAAYKAILAAEESSSR